MEPVVNPVLQIPHAKALTTIDVTITHSNGIKSKHRYNMPNEASVELVCRTNQQKTVYPLVQNQIHILFDQSSFLSHHTLTHYAIPIFRCPSSTRFNSRSLIEALSRVSNTIDPSNNQRVVSPPPGFSVMAVHPPTSEEVTKANPTGYSQDHHDVKVTDVSNDCQGIGGSSARPSETVVGSTSGRKRGRAPFIGPRPLRNKGGPYECWKCDEVFQISQALASHMRVHYLQEETEEKQIKRARRMQRKIIKQKLKAARSREGQTLAPQSSKGTKEVVALNVTVERGESSKINYPLEVGNKIKEDLV